MEDQKIPLSAMSQEEPVVSLGESYTMALPEKKMEEQGKVYDEDGNEIVPSQKKKAQYVPIPETGFRVALSNDNGLGYVGTIYVGSEERPVKVLFDTGSDYLAVTSSLCSDPKLGQKELDEPVFDPVNFAYMPSGKDHSKCKSISYNIAQSSTSHALGGDDEKLDYGSAKLQGKLYQDQVCADGNKTSCTQFDFLALYQAKGLDDTDGVLGLAVHPDKTKQNLNYVWNLKNKGMIDQAIISFSTSGPNREEGSYAIFGGINEDQIVGGIRGLKKI